MPQPTSITCRGWTRRNTSGTISRAERFIDCKKLYPAILFAREQIFYQRERFAFALFYLSQVRGSFIEINRAAVVRVDQAEIPQLAPLIKVRHAGRRDLYERLRQAVENAAVRDSRLKLREAAQEFAGSRVIENGFGELQ